MQENLEMTPTSACLLEGCGYFCLQTRILHAQGTSPTTEQIDWPEHDRINFKKTPDYRINSLTCKKKLYIRMFLVP